MPQPLTENQKERTNWRHDSFQKRPACAAGVAKVASACAFLEFRLIMTFDQALGDSARRMVEDNLGQIAPLFCFTHTAPSAQRWLK